MMGPAVLLFRFVSIGIVVRLVADRLQPPSLAPGLLPCNPGNLLLSKRVASDGVQRWASINSDGNFLCFGSAVRAGGSGSWQESSEASRAITTCASEVAHVHACTHESHKCRFTATDTSASAPVQEGVVRVVETYYGCELARFDSTWVR